MSEAELLRENALLREKLAEIQENYNVASDGLMGRHYALYYAAADEALRAATADESFAAAMWMLATGCVIQRLYAGFYAKHPEVETAVHNRQGCYAAARVSTAVATSYLATMLELGETP